MTDESKGWPPRGRTIIGAVTAGPRLVIDRVRACEWESFPRRELHRPRERLGPIKSSNTRAQKWPKSD
jgi:hypothetical protein